MDEVYDSSQAIFPPDMTSEITTRDNASAFFSKGFLDSFLYLLFNFGHSNPYARIQSIGSNLCVVVEIMPNSFFYPCSGMFLYMTQSDYQSYHYCSLRNCFCYTIQ